MQTASLAALYQILRRERSALLHYLSGAWPWTSAAEKATAQAVQDMVDAEQKELAKLAAQLRRHRVIPPSPSFPLEFGGLHYVALSYLLPRLHEENGRLLAELEKDVTTHPELNDLLQPLIAIKQAHRQKLTELAAAHAGSTSFATRR
jgi:hypothetical protein